MDRIYVTIGDFLKNAGIVGLKYLLDEAGAKENVDFGIDEQAIWLNREFAATADWTDMYFKAFVKYYGPSTVYKASLDKIDAILEKSMLDDWKQNDCKDDLKFLNDKLLSPSYQSGFENIKDKISNPQVYELLKTSKLKESMGKEELRGRLTELKVFLEQPLCAETFSMKSIIYNYINRFWDGKSFLNRKKASEDMRMIFDCDFSEPLRKYVNKDKSKFKYICIDCGEKIRSTNNNDKESMPITFMKDVGDDWGRKRSAFWNCKVDAYLCPVCAFVYALVPLGFQLIGNKFLFINTNISINELIAANKKSGKAANDAEREDGEKFSSWIAKTLNILLQEKTRALSNIQVITREKIERDGKRRKEIEQRQAVKRKNKKKDEAYRYTFDIISKDILEIFNHDGVQKNLKRLSESPNIEICDDSLNVHESVVMNILNYRNQYALINKMLRRAMCQDKKTVKNDDYQTIEKNSYVRKASLVYNVQTNVNMLKENQTTKMGGVKMEVSNVKNTGSETSKENVKAKSNELYYVKKSGYELRNELLASKGTSDDSSIRGMIYKLLNALAVCDVEHFMDVIMRVYCSTKLCVPNSFIRLLDNKETFQEYGYAFLIGLQGGHYEKEDKANE